jgi:hypothetical protein
VLVLASYAARALDAGGESAQLQAGGGAGSPSLATLFYLVAYLYFFIFLVSTVGLYAFKRWARPLFLAYHVLGFAFALIPERSIYGRAELFVGGIFAFTSALTLSLIYFSTVRDYFGRAAADELP